MPETIETRDIIVKGNPIERGGEIFPVGAEMKDIPLDEVLQLIIAGVALIKRIKAKKEEEPAE